MTVVAIKCAKCGVKFGSVDNLWLKLGKHHIALITDANTDVEVNDDEILDVTGINNDLRLEFSLSKRLSQGQSGTIVANIKLREISCTSCHMSVGSQCVEIPDEHHLLAKGQYLFFATAILLKSARDGRRKVEPEVQQTFPWIATKEQPKVFSPEDEVHRDGTDEEDLEREESVESAESTNGYLPEEHILDPEVTAALQSVVSALGQDIQLLHDELRETRAEVKKLRSENNGLKAELENTKHQVEAARESAETANSNFAVYKGDIENTHHPPAGLMLA
ncbi:hypothetical protein B0T10DRAFT_454229 [Thelonectria olida]|uniref:Uncharacterized protein n=1 Tax=Thelonectria olida TaxID=1576542 RepID=A0A9P8WHG3_9HYPO|nr:hypothetical protein B0T10DRAFT_454229 [Thelonectria olida]